MTRSIGRHRDIVAACLLAARAVAAHAQALGFGFVGLDDWELVSEKRMADRKSKGASEVREPPL
jgi:hypothetical protein